MVSKFEINDDISHAETLPADVYVDLGWYERAKEKIFARSFLARRWFMPIAAAASIAEQFYLFLRFAQWKWVA